jgi:branched-chain amino acid transport system permease protein
MPALRARTAQRPGDELRLFHSGSARFALLGLLAGYLLGPYYLSDFWLSVLDYAGIAAIGALGLNLLIGYTGQISLGQAAVLGVGAYTAGYLGNTLGLALPLWLAGAALVGAALGALTSPLALRLRGHYLAIVTLGLVFLAQHVFVNWDGLTGGLTGRETSSPASLGLIDFNHMTLFGNELSREQSWFWLIWALVGIAALLAKNIVRTRPGRAMQAIRDRDLAAGVIGIDLTRYKVGAFAVSSAFAAVGGATLAAYQQYVSPGEWTLILSIQYLAMIAIGGMGSVLGAILGALFVASLPRLVEDFSDRISILDTSAGTEGLISVFALNQMIFGALIIAFVVLEPRGLVALWLRIKSYLQSRTRGLSWRRRT